MSSDHASTFEVEPENVPAPALFGVIVFSSIIVIALVAVAVAISNEHFQYARMEATQETGYPELHETQMEGEGLLDSYDAVGDGIYRIPIERAMELEANESDQ